MFNPFDDDDASKLIGDLLKRKNGGLVTKTLEKAQAQAKKSWLDNTKLCNQALAAATIVAAARGQAGKIPVPDELTAWIVQHKFTPTDDEAALAAEVVEKIRTNSMLQEIVDDGGWPAWKRGCTELAKRLNQKAKPLKAVAAKPAAAMSPAAARKALEKKRCEFFSSEGKLRIRSDAPILKDEDYAILAQIADLQVAILGEQTISEVAVQHLQNLPKLEELVLSESNLSPAAIDQLQSLKKLVSLTIRTSATDELLAGIGKLTRLKELDLYYSKKVTNAGLKALADLKKLESLSIGFVQTDGSPLSAFPKLKILGAKNLKLSEAGLKAIGSLTALEELSCGECGGISSKGLALWKGLKKLRVLSLFRTKLDDDAFAHVAHWTGLKELSFYGVQGLSGRGIGALSSLKKLEELDLAATGVKGPDVGKLGELPKLRELNLAHTPVGDDCLEGLAKSKSLAVLSLSTTKVTGAGVAALAKMKSLRELNLQSVQLTDDVAESLMKMTWLEELNLLSTGLSPSVARQVRRTLKKTDVTINP